MSDTPAVLDILDSLDGVEDGYGRYYKYSFYCVNCNTFNPRYVRKGVRVNRLRLECQICGCEIGIGGGK